MSLSRISISRLHGLLAAAAVWMAFVAVLGARLAWDYTTGPWLGGFELAKPLAAGLVTAFCLASTLVAWWMRPTLTLVVAIGSAGLVVFVAAFMTGSMLALVVVAGTAGLAWLSGEALVGAYFQGAGPHTIRAVVAFSLGNGLLGLVLLVLGSLGRLDAGDLAIVALVMAFASLVVVVRRSRSPRLRWSPSAASGWEAVILGLASGLVAFALLTAFLPETMSDAVREHLPVTRAIWQTGSTSGLTWATARLPIHAQLVSTVAWGAGGDVGVKLSHALVGLAAVAGVGSLGWLLSGRVAALIAGVIFATIPIVQWEVGHAYVDLYPALFCITSAVAVVVWQRSGSRPVLLLGGALAGFSFAAKVVSASAVAALGLAVALVGRARWKLGERAAAVAVFGLGGLFAFMPWLIWSYQKTGSIPGLDYALGALLNPSSDIVGNLDDFGIGRDPLSMLVIPWTATFRGELFSEFGAGNLGILPLMTLPALVFIPRTRSTGFVAVAAVIAFLGWAVSAQYFRYGLPLFGLTCALLGAGMANLIGRLSKIDDRRLVYVLFGVFAIGLVITPLLTMSNWLFRIPPSYIAGRMSREELLTAYMPGFRVFDRASDIVGRGNNLGWIGTYGTPQIFTEAHIVEMTPPPAGTPWSEIVADLKSRGVSYFGWERNGTDPASWRSPLLSLSFLRDHTVLRYAADNTYLFEVFEESGDRWGLGTDSILTSLPSQSPARSAWQIAGDVTTAGTAMVIPVGSSLNQEARVTAGAPYLLVADGECARADDRLILALGWLGDAGPIGTDWQLVNPGSELTEQFVWAVAPEDATGVTAQVATWGQGSCQVEDVRLFAGQPAA